MSAPPFDAEKLKIATREQWNKSAKGWNDRSEQIRGWLRASTDSMFSMLDLGPGNRVLDVAAGAGDQTLDSAERVGPSGYVLATDLSPGILDFLKDNAIQRGIATSIPRLLTAKTWLSQKQALMRQSVDLA